MILFKILYTKKEHHLLLKQFKIKDGIQQTHTKIHNSLEQNANQALISQNTFHNTFESNEYNE